MKVSRSGQTFIKWWRQAWHASHGLRVRVGRAAAAFAACQPGSGSASCGAGVKLAEQSLAGQHTGGIPIQGEEQVELKV